jgi:hypothetical protein
LGAPTQACTHAVSIGQDACHQRIPLAHQLSEKLPSFARPVHLYAEEIGASSGRHLGNFPQAFTRLALIDDLGRVINLESDVQHTDRPGAKAPGRYLWFAGTWSRRLEHPGATLIRLT